ncbi:hypothetical protein [Streptomyces sp. NRRL WC-3742]|uniref:hypothetical protein n=1 Tax=Streptomyces sp. NRRL WC-3742 TaxID=1463934 RepID=UPI0004C692F4|nr:hypothetical protein [Streptomyces sp. NRRL WC-3742]
MVTVRRTLYTVRTPHDWTPPPPRRPDHEHQDEPGVYYTSPIVGGIALSLLLGDDTETCRAPIARSHESRPSQAMRWMYRAAGKYRSRMTARSLLAVDLWQADRPELRRALCELSAHLPYSRRWALRSGLTLTALAVPVQLAAASPQQHREAP